MIYALAITALCTMPQLDGAAEDRVDVLESNFVYDDSGRLVLSQLIGWDKSDAPGGFSVVFWRLIKDDQRGMEPQFNFATQAYTSEWHDGEVFRRVKAKARWVRHFQYDVEMRDRSYLPKDQRRGLTHDDSHYRRSTDTPSDDDLELTP